MLDEHILQALHLTTGVAVYAMDIHGDILSWNRGAEVLFGHEREQMLSENWNKLIPENLRGTENKVLTKLARGRSVSPYESKRVTRNGELLDVYLSVHPIKMDGNARDNVGSVVISTNITAEKQNFKKLEESTSKLGAVIDTALDGIISIDAEGNINAVNPMAEKQFGYHAHEMIGRNVNILMPSPYREHHDSYLKNYLNTRQAKIIGIGREVVGLRKDGSEFPMELAVNSLKIDGQDAFVGVVHDITERKKQEQEIAEQHELVKQSNRKLTQALKVLESTQAELIESEKLAALGSMVAGVAHEINTPLGICVTAASGLTRSTLETKQAYQESKLTGSQLTAFFQRTTEFTDLLTRNVDRATELIGRFKALAISQDKQETVTFDVDSFLDDLVFSVGLELQKYHCTLTLDQVFSGELEMNRVSLYQVLRILIMNAAVHGYAGKGGDIQLSLSAQDDNLNVAVSDQGCGISTDPVNKVFDPFFTTRRGEGFTGLGLHLAYNLVRQALHGSIAVSSQPEQGSTFTLSIPLQYREST